MSLLLMMKVIVGFMLSFLIRLSVAQTPPTDDLSPKIRQSIRNGNAQELTALFSKNVELLIDSENVDFSRIGISQAEQILRSFFKKRPPRTFQFVYQGAGSNVRYSTGTYWSGTDAYLVYILMKKSANQYHIETLHFRKESNTRTAATSVQSPR